MRWWAWLGLLVALLVARPARAYVPPPIQGHITDLAGKLSASERDDLEQRLEAVNRASGAEIAVLIVTSLQGETIEDVAYGTFNAWKIGKKDKDNGVLLVIAVAERRVRIETGKGVEGQLTDLQTQDIIQHEIGPALKQDHFYDAIRAGTDAIVAAISGQPQPGGGPPGPAGADYLNVLWALLMFGVFGVLLWLPFVEGGVADFGWAAEVGAAEAAEAAVGFRAAGARRGAEAPAGATDPHIGVSLATRPMGDKP